MTVYEIPNIEHCDVTPIGTMGYRLIAHEGWYIYRADSLPGGTEENPTKIYQGAAILRNDYDFSLVEICAEADLPADAEIRGVDPSEPDHEVM